MDPFHGVDLTIYLQSLPEMFTPPMQILSLLGLAEIYFLLIPAIYWCYDSRLGIRLALVFALSGWVNDILKQLFHLPRPYWISEKVQMLDIHTSQSFGFPSGHSQIPVSILGMIGYWISRRIFWIGILIFLIGVGISRVYVGVHFSLDVLGGWIIGILIVLSAIILDKPITQIISTLSDRVCLFLGLGISAILCFLSILVRDSNLSLQFPDSWTGITQIPELTDSLLSISTGFLTSGFFFGVVAGAVLLRRGESFQTKGSLTVAIIRYGFGMACLGILSAVWYFARHMSEILDENSAYWILGVLFGVWIIYGAPRLFIRVGLMSPEDPQSN